MDRRLERATSGFTLVELMIVVTVLALLATTFSLSASRPQSAAATDFRRFQAMHAQLRAQAVLSRQVLGLRLGADGYLRLRRQGGDWVPLGEPARWRGAVAVLQPFDRRAPVQFTPAGQGTPLRLRFGGAGEGGGVTICESDGWAELTCRAG